MSPEFVSALVKVQQQLPNVRKTATNPHFKSKFAPLEKVNPAVLSVLTANGFAWVTMPSVVEGQPALHYILAHTCGDSIEGDMLLLRATNPQEQGSAITYARRYAIQAVIGLVADADDDGQAASRVPSGAAWLAEFHARIASAASASALRLLEDEARAAWDAKRIDATDVGKVRALIEDRRKQMTLQAPAPQRVRDDVAALADEFNFGGNAA